jgi:hypothetical protein
MSWLVCSPGLWEPRRDWPVLATEVVKEDPTYDRPACNNNYASLYMTTLGFCSTLDQNFTVAVYG